MTESPAATPTKVVSAAIAISHRTRATMRAAAGSRGLSSAVRSVMDHPRREEVVVTDADAGNRLDRVLAASISGVSRSRLKALILAGEVTLGGRTIRDPGHRVNAGDAAAVAPPPPAPAGAPAADVRP